MTVRSGPVWVGEVELADPLTVRGISRTLRSDDGEARLLVRLHRQPIGFVTIPLSGGKAVDALQIASAVRSQLALPLARHLKADGLPPRSESLESAVGGWDACASRARSFTTEPVTVVVCTRDRPAVLTTCMKQLMELEYPNLEVKIVDNAPTTSATRQVFTALAGDDPRFSYVEEPGPGLSRARNRGLLEARTRYVAFTDDDVQVDRWWLHGIMAGFARDPRAGCVTGLVPAAELDHHWQQYFDRRYSWSARMDPCVFDLDGARHESPLYPYSAGIFGTGANFAVDRELMVALGGFDEALGAGSPAAGGEDLDAFVRVLRAGRSLVYEPAAIVWHTHRPDEAGLRRQLYAYGVGLTAFLSKYLLDRRTARDILARVPEGLRRGRRMWNVDPEGGREHAGLVWTELRGMVVGPLAYRRGRRLAR